MKCEKCNAEFTLKEQAKAKGCCPSCGEKLPASAYCNDAKAWLWYQYRSPMPFSVFLGHIYLIGIVLLALMIAPLSSDWGLWTAMNPTAQFYLVASLPIFLLPLFVFFFMPSARKWRAKCREDAAVYNVAVKSGRLSLRKYGMIVMLISLVVVLGSLWCLSQFGG